MEYAIDTRCIHGESHRHPDRNCAISYPIYQTASFSHLTPGHNPNGFDYSRESNPTRAYLEETVSALENAYDTIAFASGMAAIATMFEYFRPGDHMVFGEDLYGGVARLIAGSVPDTSTGSLPGRQHRRSAGSGQPDTPQNRFRKERTRR